MGFSYIAMHTVSTACRNVVLFSISVVQDLTFPPAKPCIKGVLAGQPAKIHPTLLPPLNHRGSVIIAVAAQIRDLSKKLILFIIHLPAWTSFAPGCQAVGVFNASSENKLSFGDRKRRSTPSD